LDGECRNIKSGNPVKNLSAFEIDNRNTVVSELSYEEPLPRQIDGPSEGRCARYQIPGAIQMAAAVGEGCARFLG
jgi:hypothetical protein